MKIRIFCYLFALLTAYGLKAYYSHATSDELDWVLRPTTALVERISGHEFEYEYGAGYLNREQRIIIAPACAGVNFMIAAFAMTLFSYLHLMPTITKTLLWTAGSLLSTYLVTITVNALRIVLALHLYATSVSFVWVNPTQLHRLEGIIVYLAALSLFFWLAGRVARRAVNSPAGSKTVTACRFPFALSLSKGSSVHGSTGSPRTDIENVTALSPGRARSSLRTPRPSQEGNRWPRRQWGMVWPFLWYLAITILVPLLNPNFQGDRKLFVEHALTITAACAVVVLLATFARKRFFPRFSLDFIHRVWHEWRKSESYHETHETHKNRKI